MSKSAGRISRLSEHDAEPRAAHVEMLKSSLRSTITMPGPPCFDIGGLEIAIDDPRFVRALLAPVNRRDMGMIQRSQPSASGSKPSRDSPPCRLRRAWNDVIVPDELCRAHIVPDSTIRAWFAVGERY
jgi:hypothetical protein